MVSSVRILVPPLPKYLQLRIKAKALAFSPGLQQLLHPSKQQTGRCVPEVVQPGGSRETRRSSIRYRVANGGVLAGRRAAVGNDAPTVSSQNMGSTSGGLVFDTLVQL